jgi:hypothetical protein
MKTNHTDITIVLDRSGSMASVASDTIGGFNRFLDDQKKAEGTATLTLNQFDDQYERAIEPSDIQAVAPLTDETFVPRGMTALLDAIGRSITDTGKRLEEMPEGDRAEKVVMVIITDGFENASSKFTKEKINEMIAHQRDVYGWEFVFLGANQDAIGTATTFGIKGANAMTYAHNAVGTQSAFASTSRNMAAFRAGTSKTMAYSAQDRDDQDKAGVKKPSVLKRTEVR